MTDLSDYIKDAPPPPEGNDNILARITALVEEAKAVDQFRAHLEAELKATNDRYRTITEFLLPEAMTTARQDQVRTNTGSTVTITEQLFGSIPSENYERALDYLISIGQEGIIKHELTLAFGKGQEQQATRAVQLLHDAEFHPAERRTVHPQTLKATLRELLAQGQNVDLNLLGAYIKRVAKIK